MLNLLTYMGSVILLPGSNNPADITGDNIKDPPLSPAAPGLNYLGDAAGHVGEGLAGLIHNLYFRHPTPQIKNPPPTRDEG